MITLRADRLHWISDNGRDEPYDLCAHSPVSLQIDDQILARPEDGEWTVSASAIFLLRALRRDHIKESRVGDQIFPCCGHCIYDVGKPEVAILGCASGIDFEIRHLMNIYQITSDDGRIIDVPENDWREAVLDFSDAVMDFYDRSMPKEPADDDERKDFSAMMIEWQRLCDYHNREKQGEDGKRH